METLSKTTDKLVLHAMYGVFCQHISVSSLLTDFHLFVFYSRRTKVFNNETHCGEYNLLNSSFCSSLFWEYGNSTCKPDLYIGSVCSTDLMTWQNCVFGTTESDIPLITELSDQEEAEELAVTILQVIGQHCMCIIYSVFKFHKYVNTNIHSNPTKIQLLCNKSGSNISFQ